MKEARQSLLISMVIFLQACLPGAGSKDRPTVIESSFSLGLGADSFDVSPGREFPQALILNTAGIIGLRDAATLSYEITPSPKGQTSSSRSFKAPFQAEYRESLAPGHYVVRVRLVSATNRSLYDSDSCFNPASEFTKEGRKIFSEKGPQQRSFEVTIPERTNLRLTLIPCVLNPRDLAQEKEFTLWDRLFNPLYNSPGWPDYPRRVLITANQVISSNTISARLSVASWSFLPSASSDLTGEVSLSVVYRSEIMLIKHARTPNTFFFYPKSQILAWEPGLQFVGQCAYSGNVIRAVSNSIRLGVKTASLPIIPIGAGIDYGNSTTRESAVAVQSISKFLQIQEGQTLDEFSGICRTMFDPTQRQNIESDLNFQVTKTLFIENRDNFSSVQAAALDGPPTPNVQANGENWNIGQANIVPGTDSVRVQGRMDRILSLFGNQPFCYDITVIKDKSKKNALHIEAQRFDNCSGSADSADWFSRGKDVARNIAVAAAERYIAL